MSQPTVTPFKRHAGGLEKFIRLINFGSRILFPPRKAVSICATQFSSIAVAKTDHLGDLLMITPVLAEIRRQCPKSKLILVIGKWNEGLARELLAQDLCTDIVVYSPWGLNRGSTFVQALRANWQSFFKARARLRDLRVGLYVDLRIWSFNSFLLGRLAGAQIMAGFAGREFSSSLDLAIPYSPDQSIGQLFLNALPMLKLTGKTYEGPFLQCRLITPLVENLRQAHPRYVILHGASADPGRTLPLEVLRRAIASVPEGVSVLLIGSRKEGEMYSQLPTEALQKCINLAGQTNLEDLLGLVKTAVGGIVSDSFIAHLCVAFQIPTVVLMISNTSQRASFPVDIPRATFVNISDLSELEPAMRAQIPS